MAGCPPSLAGASVGLRIAQGPEDTQQGDKVCLLSHIYPFPIDHASRVLDGLARLPAILLTKPKSEGAR